MSDDQDFWGPDKTDAVAAATGPHEGDVAPLTPQAESALAGFMTGGLPGLIDALSSGGEDFSDDGIEDPEALRRAEDAVAHEGRRVPGSTGQSRMGLSTTGPIDESWAPVATQLSASDSTGLEDVARSLESDGVDFGWDPYDPRDVVNFMPPSAGLTARKLFSIVVPGSQMARARESLFGAPPQGVTYSWQAAPDQAAPPAGGDAAGFEFASSSAPRQTTKEGIPLSDNAHFERMATGGPSVLVSIIVAIVAVGVVVGIISAIATVLGP